MIKNLAIAIGGLLVIGVVYGFWAQFNPEAPGSYHACTMEAKICPDGSAVGRSGPNCEFAACPEVSGMGTIQGRVMLSPTCPVERVPPAPECAPKGYMTSVTATNAVVVIKAVQTDAEGAFTMQLPAGMYTVTATGGAVLPRCESQSISVIEGKTQQINLSCDSGIR